MPWGKWRGVRLRLIPDAYLSWLTTTVIIRDHKWNWLKQSLIAELEYRGMRYDLAETPDPEPSPAPETNADSRTREILGKMEAYL